MDIVGSQDNQKLYLYHLVDLELAQAKWAHKHSTYHHHFVMTDSLACTWL